MNMNRLQIFALWFFGVVLFLGCQKWGTPEFKAEEWVGPTETNRYYTIGPNPKMPALSILKRHISGNPPDTILPPQARGELRYLRAVVVSSDEGGNYYKSMAIQDATGGIELELDMNGLYNFYPVGQKIVLVLNDLLIGDYNNLPQIGWLYNGNQIGRINSMFFDKYIIRDGLPNPKNVPEPLTNDKIDYGSTRDLNKLVRLEGVKFEESAFGKPFAFNDFTTEWKVFVPLSNGTNEPVVVRTSNFAKFRNMIIENKEYNLTGILTTYRSTKQLMIRTKDNIELVQSLGSISFDFSTNPLGAGWSIHSLLPTTTKWVFKSNFMQHLGNDIVEAYKVPMDDWLISPMITCSDYQKNYLIFEHQLSMTPTSYKAYQVFYSTSASTPTPVNLSEWKLLAEVTGSESFAWSNKIPLSKIGSNTFRIAFRYNLPNKDDEAFDWSIKKVEIRK